MTAVGTLYRRALRRVQRRAALYSACPCDRHFTLLRQACLVANDLSRGVTWRRGAHV